MPNPSDVIASARASTKPCGKPWWLHGLLLGLSALGLMTPPGPVAAQRAHEHGVADAEVAVDGDRLTVMLRVPLDSLVGFESAPTTARQRERVRAMADRLHRPVDLIVPTAAAACELERVALASPVIAADLLAAPSTTKPASAATPSAAASSAAPTDAARSSKPRSKGADPKHADLEATWAFRCRQPQALADLSLAGLFKSFDGLRQIRAGVVSAKGQSGSLMSPRRTRIVL